MTLITVLLSVFLGRQPITLETGPAFITSMRWSLLVFTLMSVAGIFCSLGRISSPSKDQPASMPPEERG